MPRLVKKRKNPDDSPINYTAKNVSMMIGYVLRNSSPAYSETRIRELAERENLFIYLDSSGRRTSSSSKAEDAFIPKDRLPEIIAGLELQLTLEDLENAAYKLGFQY